MKQNINIEAEGNELVLKNKAGDYVIIPKKHRLEVQDMIKENCHSCIDKLVETLPIMEDYAQDGSLYPKEPVINPNNPIKLPEVTITAEAPTWVKYRKEYEKDNPYKPYQEKNEYLRRFKPERVQAKEKIYKAEWERKRDNYVDAMMAAEKRINDLWDYEQRKSNGDLKWWEKKVKGVNTTPQQDEAMIQQQAQMQLDWKNKPLEEKIGIIGMEAALGFLPEIAMVKYAKNVGQVGNAIKSGKKLIKPVSKVVKSTDKVIDATKVGSKVLSKTDDAVKNASLIPNWTVSKIKSIGEMDELDDLHPVFKTFDKDTWKKIAQKKGNDYFLDRFNKQLVNVTNDLNSYENLAINISDYPKIIEGKKWTEDFVKSPEWKQRVKNANPDLTEEQINNLQKSTLLSMPSNMKTFIKNQASKNSSHGGQFTYDDLIHGRNVAFKYFTPEEVLDHPLHFKSLASHEFGHSQSSMRKLPNDKSWHQPLEESGDMMKTNDIYKGDRYVELSEEKRARSIPSYMFAKENNLLENGEFTEKTYNILKNMAEKDWKSVPNDFNSILQWYDKKSAINYLNKFYATIPFYLYLQSQNQNKTE